MGKTNAENCRNYYLRKKAQRQQESSAKNNVSIKKTGAERTRAHRLRRKMLAEVNQSCVNEISPLTSTSNPQKITFKPQPVITGANSNNSDVAMLSGCFSDHVGDNSHNTFSSTVTHDNRNSTIVQYEVHKDDSPVQCDNHTTSRNIISTEIELSPLSQERKNIEQSAEDSNMHDLSNEDIVHNQEQNLFNQNIVMDQELLQSDEHAIHSNSSEHGINIFTGTTNEYISLIPLRDHDYTHNTNTTSMMSTIEEHVTSAPLYENEDLNKSPPLRLPTEAPAIPSASTRRRSNTKQLQRKSPASKFTRLTDKTRSFTNSELGANGTLGPAASKEVRVIHTFLMPRREEEILKSKLESKKSAPQSRTTNSQNPDNTNVQPSLIEEYQLKLSKDVERRTLNRYIGLVVKELDETQRTYASILINEVISQAQKGNLNRNSKLIANTEMSHLCLCNKTGTLRSDNPPNGSFSGLNLSGKSGNMSELNLEDSDCGNHFEILSDCLQVFSEVQVRTEDSVKIPNYYNGVRSDFLDNTKRKKLHKKIINAPRKSSIKVHSDCIDNAKRKKSQAKSNKSSVLGENLHKSSIEIASYYCLDDTKRERLKEKLKCYSVNRDVPLKSCTEAISECLDSAKRKKSEEISKHYSLHKNIPEFEVQLHCLDDVERKKMDITHKDKMSMTFAKERSQKKPEDIEIHIKDEDLQFKVEIDSEENSLEEFVHDDFINTEHLISDVGELRHSYHAEEKLNEPVNHGDMDNNPDVKSEIDIDENWYPQGTYFEGEDIPDIRIK